MGMDTHKQFSFVTALTEKGDVIKQEKLVNFSDEFNEFFRELSRNKTLEIAIESTEMIMPFVKALERYGKIKVAHPTKLRLIAESKVKTDKIDSTVIANLLRTNYLPESYIPPEEIREIRTLCREHYAIKALIVRVKNQIRHYLLSQGIIREDNVFTKENRKKLREMNSDFINRKLDMLECMEEKLREVDDEIKERVSNVKEVELLTTIPGIGIYTAALLYSEIADIERFKKFSKLCSYVGLNPSMYQSGNRKYFGRITKQGNGCGSELGFGVVGIEMGADTKRLCSSKIRSRTENLFRKTETKERGKESDRCNSKKVAEKGVCSVEEERALRKLWFVVIMAF